jgi:glycine/D-amino acid oxidase-like deaminating enzyme
LRDVLSADFRETPYWHDAMADTPREDAPPPDRADAVVIGCGVAGAAGAHELARGGRRVVVLDAGEPGHGASSRNAGFLGRNFQHAFIDLEDRFGLDVAKAVFEELHLIYREAVERIEGESLDCDLRPCGRVVLAHSEAQRHKLLREYAARERHLGEKLVGIEDAPAAEIAAPRYWAGVTILDNAAIHPGKYAVAMIARARAAGALVLGRAPATGLRREKDGFSVAMPRGTIRARDVLICTNGHTGALTPWLERRLTPIDAYMVATEAMEPARLAAVLPRLRTYLESGRASRYWRPSPDGTRLLFGGLTNRRVGSPRDAASRLHGELAAVFAPMADIRVSHAWTGRCAATWDLFPRMGVHDGAHHAVGFCFSGMAIGPYLAVRAARRILGRKVEPSAFARQPFPTVPAIARSRAVLSALMAFQAWAERARRPPVNPGS